MLEPFALRFAHPSPLPDVPGVRTRIASIKGTSRIDAGGLRLDLTDGYTSPDTTIFGEIPDYGPSDWDGD
jgi:hypothetical protein